MTASNNIKTYIVLKALRANGSQYALGDTFDGDQAHVNYDKLIEIGVIKEILPPRKTTTTATAAAAANEDAPQPQRSPSTSASASASASAPTTKEKN